MMMGICLAMGWHRDYTSPEFVGTTGGLVNRHRPRCPWALRNREIQLIGADQPHAVLTPLRRRCPHAGSPLALRCVKAQPNVLSTADKNPPRYYRMRFTLVNIGAL